MRQRGNTRKSHRMFGESKKMNGAQTRCALDRRHNLPHGVYQTVRYAGTPSCYRSV